MAKEFAKNFVVSLVLYLGVSILAYWAWAGIWWGAGLRVFGITGTSPSWLVSIVSLVGVALSTGVSVVLFFSLGRKFRLLSNHWLNYLSVSGSLIIGIIVGVATVDLSSLFLAIFPFIMLWSVVGLGAMQNTPEIYLYVFTSVVALMPPTNIWLGMLYQSRIDNAEGNES